MTNPGDRVKHGEVYEHEVYGQVEVLEILDPIEAIGPDGPERNYFIKFSPVSVGQDPKIRSEHYQDFTETTA